MFEGLPCKLLCHVPCCRTEYDEGGRYGLLIEDAHAAASSAAMELLRRSENLAGGLAVLKRYFLVAQVGGAGMRHGCKQGPAEGLL